MTPLGARRLTPLLLLPVAGLLALSIQRTWRESSVITGVELAAGAGGVVVAAVEAGSAAERAGLNPGDGVIEIGGHPVRTVLVGRDLLAQARPGRPLGVVVAREGRVRALRVHPETHTEWRSDRIATTTVGFLFWLAAAAALIRPRRSAATAVYVVWCLVGAVVLGVSWSPRGERLDWLLFWVDRAARLALPALWAHLALTLQSEPRRARRWLPAVYTPALALLLAEVHLVGLGGALRSADPVALVDWLQSRVELGWLAIGFVGGLVLLARSAALATNLAERARSRWFFAGAVVGLGPFLVLSVAPQLWALNEPSWSWIATLFLAVLPLVFTGAVLDFRLMDLTYFVRRLVTATVTVAFSITLFLGLLTVADYVTPLLLHPPGIVPPLVAAVITAALAPAIRSGARDLVGRLFYRRRYNFRRALQRVARDLNAERDLLRLTEALERRVAEALNAGVARLLLCEPGGSLIGPAHPAPLRDRLSPSVLAGLERGEIQTLAMMPDAPQELPALNRAGVQVLAPLRVEGALIAVLAIGPKPGGLLDSDDLDLLRSVAAHAAAAVAGALHLAELREQMHLVQRLQARTEALVDSSPLGLVVLSRDGRIQHWNPAVEQLLGVQRDDALNRPFTEILPAALRGLVQEFLRAAPDAARSRAYRVRVGEHGRGKLVDLAASPLRGPDGAEGVLLTLDDVSERVRLEDQLIQQDRLASVGLLAAGVAHEVNTPLTGISSYAQILLEDSPADDPRRPLLEKIVQQAARASQIARGLLRFSRPTAVDGIRFGPVDLREMVEETVGLVGPQIRRARATVECSSENGAAVALGDRARLQQVTINLLLNALDAVEAGGRIAVRVFAVNESEVGFEVEDDGVGISEELRGRIFDPFFTTKKAGEGTGLGLSISYSIVREHRGALTADSEPGQGTVMRVTLPSAVSAIQAESAPGVDARRAG